MSEASHVVAFHIDSTRVVCACGADFKTQFTAYDWPDALALWAKHLAETREWGTASELWDQGFTAACEEHMKQEREPDHYFTRENPYGEGLR